MKTATTLKTPENQKTTLEAHWTTLASAQNATGQTDHNVKDVRVS